MNVVGPDVLRNAVEALGNEITRSAESEPATIEEEGETTDEAEVTVNPEASEELERLLYDLSSGEPGSASNRDSEPG